MKCLRLSYMIGEKSPLYPGSPNTAIKKVRAIGKGDSCNTFLVKFSNHAGTHIDAPRHFFDKGKPISDYSAGELIFKRPVMIDCPKKAGEAVEISDLEGAVKAVSRPDLLLIRTGFSRCRGEDVRTYCCKNPYLSPEAAEWLKDKFTTLRAVGIDCISIASRANREAGRRAHSVLLGSKGRHSGPVLIIEDLYIPADAGKLDMVIASPILIEGADSAPCAVLGIQHD